MCLQDRKNLKRYKLLIPSWNLFQVSEINLSLTGKGSTKELKACKFLNFLECESLFCFLIA